MLHNRPFIVSRRTDSAETSCLALDLSSGRAFFWKAGEDTLGRGHCNGEPIDFSYRHPGRCTTDDRGVAGEPYRRDSCSEQLHIVALALHADFAVEEQRLAIAHAVASVGFYIVERGIGPFDAQRRYITGVDLRIP
jgi:hypothetical protein